MLKLECPKCGHTWEMNYWKWILKAPFHMFNFIKWKDKRKIKCPNCGQRSWIYKQ